MIIVYICVFIDFFFKLASWYQSPPSLKPAQLIHYLTQSGKQWKSMDVVILPPFVWSADRKTNYSVLSVLRFAPWVRRIHVMDPEAPLTFIPDSQKPRVVSTRADLVAYSLTTSQLSEEFIVLKPNFLFTNYVFAWQFFVDQIPVWRTCSSGALPLTRTLLNECIYHKIPASSYLKHAVEKATKSKVAVYGNNRDHFASNCQKKNVMSVQQVTSFKEEDIRDFFQFEEIHKDYSRPYQIVLGIIEHPKDYAKYLLLPELQKYPQIWVVLCDSISPDDHLSLLHQMVVTKNTFFHLRPAEFRHDTEAIGAEIMRRIRDMSNQQPYKVKQVHSYGISPSLAHQVAQKLVVAYENIPFEPLETDREWSVSQRREQTRLQYL